MTDDQHVVCVVTGRVQMVWYRKFVQMEANKRGVIGWVRNCPNGSVEVHAWQEESVLRDFVACLWKGSALSRVDKVSEIWDNSSYDGGEKIFSILR